MTSYDILERYVSLCSSVLQEDDRFRQTLSNHGLTESFLFESFTLGYSDGNVLHMTSGNEELQEQLTSCGLLKNGKEVFTHRLIIPIYDENRVPVNIVGYSFHPKVKQRAISLNHTGIFNAPFLQNTEEIIFTDDPLHTLKLICYDYPNATFLFGDDQKYLHFIQQHGIRKAFFLTEGKAKLLYELTRNGVCTERVPVDFDRFDGMNAKSYLDSVFTEKQDNIDSADTIQEIENGFLFQFFHLSYRVIGNFSGNTMSMKANVKAFTGEDTFVDQIDLYKNRDRQNFVFNLMDRFALRDQTQLEEDLNRIIEVIEKHREKKENENKQVKPELTDHQKQIGMQFLSNPDLIDEIEADYTKMGYVREKKNKILLYLVMTSRLMETPLHVILVSRSGAGKSLLVELTEEFCPPEELQSVSDITQEALYYFDQDGLKHRFVVIGEKEGSEGADYPLRELISKRSISKAIPMKDQVTGKIKTVNITVDGPIALAETTTSSFVNPENLNRCFVIGIDESEEQTKLIHELQRKNYTLEGLTRKKELAAITEKHIYAQRLLKKVQVVNPFAQLLSFPTATLRTRRDHDKFLRLINVVCFLHQYQRKAKRKQLEGGEEIEYLECALEDYRIAYDLLTDGVLDNTLDDLPSSARKLLNLIKRYLHQRSERDKMSVEKIIFERKEIRDYTSWSFAQVRNNFRILKDYEYIQVMRSRNGVSHQYRLNGNYSEVDVLHTILSPEALERRISSAATRTS